jgi:palmitoyltransferase
VLLLAIIGYTSWVITKVECLDYLLRPPTYLDLPRRQGTAIAILVIYYILLFMLLVSYARLVLMILTNPGVVPRGPQWYVEKERKKSKKAGGASEKEDASDADSEGYSPKGAFANAESYRVQDFWMKDVFICQHDGRPKFCSQCYNYKVDRVHHCSELGRCVYKMDHFCPWVGGIVSETSFKFFIQFTFWTALFCFFNLVQLAYFLAERQRHTSGVDVHWILGLAFSGLFFLFGAGMCGSSLQFAFENTTTIENINRRSQVYFMAVYVPEATWNGLQPEARDKIRWISYPRPAQEHLQVLQNAGADYPEATVAPSNPPSPLRPQIPTLTTHSPSASTNSNPSPPRSPPTQKRMFAILETSPGTNPFSIGTMANFKEVMGPNAFDWLIPLRTSPCASRRNSPHSMYKFGRVVYKLKKNAGLLEPEDREVYGHRQGGRRSRSRTSSRAGPRQRGERKESRRSSERGGTPRN